MDVDLIITLHKAALKKRINWDNYWDDLSFFFDPKSQRHNTQRTEGQELGQLQFDSTPQQVAQRLALILGSFLRPPGEDWFSITTEDPDTLDDYDKLWLDMATKTVRSRIYAQSSMFERCAAQNDLELVIKGTAALYLNEVNGRLIFQKIPLADIAFDVDHYGELNRAFRTVKWNAEQLVDKFGKDRLHREVIKAYENNDSREWKLVYAVLPRYKYKDANPYLVTPPKSRAFGEYWVDLDNNHMIREGGCYEFPFIPPRWSTDPMEVYGRSPCMTGLPDARGLQKMGETIQYAAEMAVTPPLLVNSSYIGDEVRINPRSMTFADIPTNQDVARPLFGNALTSGLPYGLEVQQDVREMVSGALFVNVLQLPFSPDMTATEVLQHTDDMLRVAAPLVTPVQGVYNGGIINRAFRLLYRLGNVFPDITDGLRDREIDFEYESPIKEAERRQRGAKVQVTVQSLAGLAEATQDPSVYDNINTDQAARILIESAGSVEVLRPEDERDAVREQRQQAAQEQQQLDQAAQAAQLAPGLARAERDLAEAETT